MTFGQTLRQLLTISGVKSAALASRLGYDTSYISRWISDIKLPSLKNNSRLFSQIAEGILEESDSSAREELRQTFCRDGSDAELEQAIESALSLAFTCSRPAVHQQATMSRNAICIPDGFPVRLQRLSNLTTIRMKRSGGQFYPRPRFSANCISSCISLLIPPIFLQMWTATVLRFARFLIIMKGLNTNFTNMILWQIFTLCSSYILQTNCHIRL